MPKSLNVLIKILGPTNPRIWSWDIVINTRDHHQKWGNSVYFCKRDELNQVAKMNWMRLLVNSIPFPRHRSPIVFLQLVSRLQKIFSQAFWGRKYCEGKNKRKSICYSKKDQFTAITHPLFEFRYHNTPPKEQQKRKKQSFFWRCTGKTIIKFKCIKTLLNSGRRWIQCHRSPIVWVSNSPQSLLTPRKETIFLSFQEHFLLIENILWKE